MFLYCVDVFYVCIFVRSFYWALSRGWTVPMEEGLEHPDVPGECLMLMDVQSGIEGGGGGLQDH